MTTSRTIVVTGGGRGIGRAIALGFAEPGATIVITARTESQLQQAAEDIRAKGARAIAIPMDVSDEASVAHGFGSLHGQVTQVHVLVNNAGVGGGENVQGSDVARWKHTIDTNLTGMYLVTRQVLPLMANDGRIVNLSSVLGRFGVPGYTAYCASKHGVIGFTRALALELVKRRITVNAIAPGFFPSKMTHSTIARLGEAEMAAKAPLNRLGDDDDLKGAALLFASKAGKHITGQILAVDGGVSAVHGS